MVDLLSLLLKYGWQVFALGVLSCVVLGLIKTPVLKLVRKKFPEKDTKVENWIDTIGYLSNILISAVVVTIYLFITKAFSLEALIANTLSTWLVSLAAYGSWKKLGLKRILQIVWKAITRSVSKAADKNEDGNISFEEATTTVQGLLKDGKLDVKDLLEIAEQSAPGILESAVKDISDDAGKEAMINPKEEMQKVKDSLESIAKPQASPTPVESRTVNQQGKQVSIYKLTK